MYPVGPVGPVGTPKPSVRIVSGMASAAMALTAESCMEVFNADASGGSATWIRNSTGATLITGTCLRSSKRLRLRQALAYASTSISSPI